MIKDRAGLEAIVASERAVLDGLPLGDVEDVSLIRGVALWRIGEALFRLGRMEDAANELEEAARFLTFVPGFEREVLRACAVRLAALLVLKRYEEVIDASADVIARSTALESVYHLKVGLINRALALKAVGRWYDASTAASELLAAIGDDPPLDERSLMARGLLIQAGAARRSGHPELGVPLAEKAIAAAADAENRDALHDAMRERAEDLYHAGRLAAAGQAYRDVEAEFRNGPEEFAKEAVAFARARRLRIRVQSVLVRKSGPGRG